MSPCWPPSHCAVAGYGRSRSAAGDAGGTVVGELAGAGANAAARRGRDQKDGHVRVLHIRRGSVGQAVQMNQLLEIVLRGFDECCSASCDECMTAAPVFELPFINGNSKPGADTLLLVKVLP